MAHQTYHSCNFYTTFLRTYSLLRHTVLQACRLLYNQPFLFSFRAQIPLIAALSNLTKLHLNMRGQPDFSSLAQLNKLEDLALRCSSHSDFSEVIYSNRFSLQRLTIGSQSLTNTTYAAVSLVASLKDALFLVGYLSESNAALVANLVHPIGCSVAIHFSRWNLVCFDILIPGCAKLHLRKTAQSIYVHVLSIY